jgi:hypothetical protein
MSNPYRLQHLRRFANGLSVGLVRGSARTSGGADHWAELFSSVQRSLSGARAADAALQSALSAEAGVSAAPATAAVESSSAKSQPKRRSAVMRPLPAELAFARPIDGDLRAMQFFAGLPFSGVPRNRPAPASAQAPSRRNEAPVARVPDADQRAGNLFRSLAWHGKPTRQPIHIEPGSATFRTAKASGAGPEVPTEFAPTRVFATQAASFLQSVPWDAIPRSSNTQAPL